MAVFEILRKLAAGYQIILILSIVQSGHCISLQTVNVLEHVKFNCGTKTVYTVASEMQCYQRCLRKNNCRIINYKASDNEVTVDNCEVFEVATINGACTSEGGMNNWKAITLLRNGEQETVKKENESCKQIKEEKPDSSNGVYDLKSGKHHCIMNNSQCGQGGWTLAMKINGTKATFDVTSSYWESNTVYNIENGLTSFEDDEAKFPAFITLGFTSICLGFNVKRDGNVVMFTRIGLIANGENTCASPDTLIGFGVPSSGSYPSSGGSPIFSTISCGNANSLAAMGYILIQ
eukprot:gene10885-12041_t